MRHYIKGLLAVSMLFISTIAFSQVDLKFLAGLGFSFTTGPDAIGLHLRGDVDITEQWGGGVNFMTYFKSDINYWELNFDGHYFFPINEEFTAYPLAGLNISHYGIPGLPGNIFGVSTGGTKIGLNIGGGARYMVASQISIIGEIKYIISSFDALVITAGGVYHF